jgi:membrane protein
MIKLQRLIVESKIVVGIDTWSKRITLPGFHKLSLNQVTQFFAKQISNSNIGQRAAAISYNFIIAIPAGFLFLFTIVPLLPKTIRLNFEEGLFKLITHYFTPTAETAVWLQNSIDDFINTQRGTLSLLGLFLIVWATSNAMIGIKQSFDSSILVKKQRNFLQNRFNAIKLTSLLIFIVIACVTLLITEGIFIGSITKLFNLKGATTKLLFKFLDWVIIISITIISIGAIYRYAPSVHKRWPLITPGSILTTFLLLFTTFIFSYWVSNFGSYNKLYGSVGSVIILMILIYFNSLVLLIGFELNNSIRNLHEEKKITHI